jgi:hypothetical protein
LKLLQQKYKLEEDAVRKWNKGPLYLSKTVLSFFCTTFGSGEEDF